MDNSCKFSRSNSALDFVLRSSTDYFSRLEDQSSGFRVFDSHNKSSKSSWVVLSISCLKSKLLQVKSSIQICCRDYILDLKLIVYTLFFNLLWDTDHTINLAGTHSALERVILILFFNLIFLHLKNYKKLYIYKGLGSSQIQEVNLTWPIFIINFINFGFGVLI